jgi:hypothetical protein
MTTRRTIRERAGLRIPKMSTTTAVEKTSVNAMVAMMPRRVVTEDELDDSNPFPLVSAGFVFSSVRSCRTSPPRRRTTRKPENYFRNRRTKEVLRYATSHLS